MQPARSCLGARSCLLSVFLSIAGASCSNNDSSSAMPQSIAPGLASGSNSALQGGSPNTIAGNANDDSLTAPTAPTLNLRAAAGQLQFSWPTPPAESSSKIIQANLVTREYTPVFTTQGNLVNEFTLPLAIHRADWQNTRYFLETCDADHCLLSVGKRIDKLSDDLLTVIPRESVSAGERYAQSLALSADGNTLVSGASRPGRALVQFRVGNQWWDSTTLSGNSLEPEAEFAHSVAIGGNGNTLAVGAPGEKSQSGAAAGGAVYIYERLGEGWANSARLSSTDASLTRFGARVVISDDANLMLVGVPDAAVNGQEKAGKVLVYQRISSQWRLSQTLQAERPTAMARYADTLSLAGGNDLLFIGDQAEQGRVHEYKLHNGQFNLVDSLDNTLVETTQFAESLASDRTGNTLVVSRRGTSAANSLSLEVLVYQRASDGQWWLQQTMAPPDVLSSDSSIKFALSADASTLSIGVHNPLSSSNSVTTYTSDRPWVAGGFTWARSGTLYSPGSGDDEFAQNLALSGNGRTLVVAAPGAAKEGLAESGETYVW